ncbi:MAG TPA: hypothetical protein VG346_05035 [Acidimicrobiales bacterium]|jgi:hypothetical protein|nr:hypothetical protein [Acidimicrobiales bacterium]
MAEAIILEFRGDPDLYHRVNAILGISPADGGGEWPDGMLSHVGASKDGNSLVVFEVWESQSHQEAFMNTRLGPALAEAGAPEPARIEWFAVEGQMPG